MLKQRIIMGCILIPLALLGIYYLPLLGFQLVLGIIALGCGWEWTHLMKMHALWERILFLVLIGLFCFAVTWVAMGYYLYAMLIGMAILIYFIHRFQTQKGQFQLKEVWWYVIGLFTIVTFWYSLCIIRFKVGGSDQLLFLLLIVWAADIGAFFVGRKFGKTTLCTFVSPKKNWEGVKGGAVCVFMVTLIEGIFYKTNFPHFLLMVFINMVTFIVAVYGDLFESMMKRMADVKDSGSLIPGHGGLLDRLDSLFFAAPWYATALLLTAIYF